jgi:hypothetical protein
MDTKEYLESAFKDQFVLTYKEIPTETELKDFMNLWLGKNKSIKGQDEWIVNNISRNSFRSQFYFVYEYEPTEEQLDMFISFMLGVVKDSGIVSSVCNVNHNKKTERDEEKQKQ